MTEVCRMTSVIELSTSIGPSGMLRNTTATADATLDEIEAELVATYVARTQRPSADGIKLFSDRSVEDKLRICQDETAVAAARMLQVMSAPVYTQAAALALLVPKADAATFLTDK